MPSLLLLTKDGVHEQHLSPVHVWRELCIVDFGFLCLLIALDKDLADPDGAAAVPETLFHSFTCVKKQQHIQNEDQNVICSNKFVD